MIQVQFRVEVQDETHFQIHYDILSREDVNDLEQELAKKVQVVFLEAFHRAAKAAGLNAKEIGVDG